VQNLRAAIAQVEAQDDDLIDERELASLVDRLQAKLCRVVAAVKRRGDYQLAGYSAVTWVAKQCQMSKTAAADRLCVGAQLAKMPHVAQALQGGEIGFQAASVICHLQERVEQAGGSIDQEAWVENARCFSIKDLSGLAASTWHAVDPAGFNLKVEEAHERRQLFISECGDMYRIDGWLELSSGAVLKTAIDALAHPLGRDDYRSPKQRRADAVVELAHHVMDEGRLPKRNGVRPHVSVHTTIEGLKGELGAAASELSNGAPISSQTVQRLACDGALHRVLKADSMVIDVGRAHRTAQPSQWRALKARHKSCAAPGCDRPINWTQAHHLDFWEDGGRTDHGKLLPLCYFHHRLVHEGDWQVVMVCERVEFIPPDRPVMIKRRWGDRRWAA
jgi:hypothetical protein